MGRLPQLPLALCFAGRPRGLPTPPPPTEDAFRRSLQLTYCQRAPDDSTVFRSRQLTLPSAAAGSPANAATPRRRFVHRTPTLALVRRRNGSPAYGDRAVDAARFSCSPGTNKLRGARNFLRHGRRHCLPARRAVRLVLLMPPVAPTPIPTGSWHRRERLGPNPSPSSKRKEPCGPRHLPPLVTARSPPPESGSLRTGPGNNRRRSGRCLRTPRICASRALDLPTRPVIHRRLRGRVVPCGFCN